MRNIKFLRYCALAFILLFTACGSNELTTDELVGIWRPASFEEDFARLFWGGSVVAVYITYDGNLFIHHTSESSIGEITDTLHFSYEIVGDQLALTPISGSRSYDMDAVKIITNRNQLTLDLREASSFVDPSGLRFTLYRIQDYVPFGWSDSDQEDMRKSRTWVQEEIHAFAERLSEALGLSVLPYDGFARTEARFVYQHIVPFIIDDIVIEIAFVGTSPTPTRPQSRHVWRGNPQILEFGSILNANRQLALIYCEWRTYIPEEWVDVVSDLY